MFIQILQKSKPVGPSNMVTRGVQFASDFTAGHGDDDKLFSIVNNFPFGSITGTLGDGVGGAKPTWGVNGAVFDGTQYIKEVGLVSDFNFLYNSDWSAIVRVDIQQNPFGWVWFWDDYLASTGCGLTIRNSGTGFAYLLNAQAFTNGNQTTPNAGAMHTIGVTYTIADQKVKLYVDGNLVSDDVDSDTMGTITQNTTIPMWFGAAQLSNLSIISYIIGTMRFISFHNVALSGTEQSTQHTFASNL